MRQNSINRRSNRILYNVTVSVEALIYADWIAYMRENHIPKIFSTHCFSGYKICRMLDESTETYTLALQYFAENIEKFQEYQSNHAAELQRQYLEHFGEGAPAFRTVLHVVEEGEVITEAEVSKN